MGEWIGSLIYHMHISKNLCANNVTLAASQDENNYYSERTTYLLSIPLNQISLVETQEYILSEKNYA